MIFVTCLTLAATLNGPSTDANVVLAPGSTCSAFTYARKGTPVTLDAAGATLTGLTVTGSDLTIRGATLQATGGGYGTGPVYYGLNIKPGSARITLDGVTVTNARKGIVVDGSSDVTVRSSKFVALGEDGIIASNTARFVVIYSDFRDFRPKRTSCTKPTGIVAGLSAKDCVAAGGVWADGYHSDAVQLRDGIVDGLIGWNTVDTVGQGLGIFATTGDRPEQRVAVIGNKVAVGGYHSLTFGENCLDCIVRGNAVSSNAVGIKTIIRVGAAVSACGNTSVTASVGTAACKP